MGKKLKVPEYQVWKLQKHPQFSIPPYTHLLYNTNFMVPFLRSWRLFPQFLNLGLVTYFDRQNEADKDREPVMNPHLNRSYGLNSALYQNPAMVTQTCQGYSMDRGEMAWRKAQWFQLRLSQSSLHQANLKTYESGLLRPAELPR